MMRTCSRDAWNTPSYRKLCNLRGPLFDAGPHRLHLPLHHKERDSIVHMCITQYIVVTKLIWNVFIFMVLKRQYSIDFFFIGCRYDIASCSVSNNTLSVQTSLLAGKYFSSNNLGSKQTHYLLCVVFFI
jgi:hypothetical protein